VEFHSTTATDIPITRFYSPAKPLSAAALRVLYAKQVKTLLFPRRHKEAAEWW
jgi:hypothetical protein